MCWKSKGKTWPVLALRGGQVSPERPPAAVPSGPSLVWPEHEGEERMQGRGCKCRKPGNRGAGGGGSQRGHGLHVLRDGLWVSYLVDTFVLPQRGQETCRVTRLLSDRGAILIPEPRLSLCPRLLSRKPRSHLSASYSRKP